LGKGFGRVCGRKPEGRLSAFAVGSATAASGQRSLAKWGKRLTTAKSVFHYCLSLWLE